MFIAVTSPLIEKPAILAIFAVTYLGIAAGRVPGLRLDRTGIVMLGAIAIMVFGGFQTQTIIGFINWPTMLLLFGFFVLSAQLRLSGFFDAVAGALARRLDHPKSFLFLLMLSTAGLSMFLNNDIVCFAFAPIVGTALLRRQLSPVPFLIAMAIASNIGAAGTFVGNSQNMMIAQTSGLNFGLYMLWCAVPVLFALGAAYGLIWAMSHRELTSTGQPAGEMTSDPIPFDRPHTIKGLVILVIVIGLFFTRLPKELVALTAAAVHLASRKFNTVEILKLVDWPILMLFMGLFVVTGAFQTTGYSEQAIGWLAHVGLHLQSLATLALVTASLSNLINNSAAVMLLLKVANIVHPPAAYVLALSNSFGGGFLIVGSVSNMIVVQQARSLGIQISFRDFARVGVPVTLVALGGLLIWVILVT
jgi:Na+/H+ antiporter NhaD/arsenite permease-like protein